MLCGAQPPFPAPGQEASRVEYLRLAPGLPPSSRLGFGCGSVMGRVGRAQSLRAIAAACDAGINHFDVARLYGYGEAEALLGEALRGRRDRVVLASKFGLVPTRAAVALRGLKPLVQALVARVPGVRPLIRAAVGTARTAGGLTAAAAEASLHESLRALNTDYLDILFLHDGAAADLTPELVGFFETQIAAGTIRAWGVASGIETVAELLPIHDGDILYQFGNSVCLRNAECLPPAAGSCISHNPFLGADRLITALREYPEAFCLPDGRAIATGDIHPLMLGYALAAERIGVVLCSMLDPAHLRANVAAAERPAFNAAEIAAFAASVRAVEPGGMPA
jgi:aryl-alcohol dehydrogenase-like predicted oxidoreductase